MIMGIKGLDMSQEAIENLLGSWELVEVQPISVADRNFPTYTIAGEQGMQNVTVYKTKLIDIVVMNRVKHKAEFDEAVVEFRKACRLKLQEAVAAIKPDTDPVIYDKGLKSLQVSLSAPDNHLEDYDLALKMLELEVKDEVILTNDEFSQLVNDDWSWKRSFSASNSLYKNTLFSSSFGGTGSARVPDIG